MTTEARPIDIGAWLTVWAEADEHDVVASAIALRRVQGLCVNPSRRLGD